MFPPRAFNFGDYRKFLGKDEFPGLPPKAIPILINKEDDQYTFVLAVMNNEPLLFAWDKISPVYNMYQGL